MTWQSHGIEQRCTYWIVALDHNLVIESRVSQISDRVSLKKATRRPTVIEIWTIERKIRTAVFELFRDPNKPLPFGNRQDGRVHAWGKHGIWNAKCGDGFLTAIMQTWRLHPGKLTWNPKKRERRWFSFSIGWLLASMLILEGVNSSSRLCVCTSMVLGGTSIVYFPVWYTQTILELLQATWRNKSR